MLILVGAAALSFASPIAFVIAAILAIVVFSYRQTIHAYPNGGGAYIVAKDNLGEYAGADRRRGAADRLRAHRRGEHRRRRGGDHVGVSAMAHSPGRDVARVRRDADARQSARHPRVRAASSRCRPISSSSRILVLIGVGLWRCRRPAASSRSIAVDPGAVDGISRSRSFSLLTAFSNGCTAMTGVEAVSNGVPAFKPPEAKNAAATMLMMAVLSITMFLGITLLAQAYHVLPSEQETVVSQLARGVFGGAASPYYARPGGDDADPGAGGEHRVRRLPAAGVDPRARSLPAAPVHEPGRPAGVLERHRRPQRLRGDCCSWSSAATRTR